MKITVNVNTSAILNRRGLGSSTRARKYLATSVARFCDPYVPMSAGSGAHMKNARHIAEDGSSVIYPGPYAHYQYVGLVMEGRAPKHYTNRPLNYHGGPMRGKEWDKRMMADHKDDVVKDLAAYVGGRAK